MVSSFRNAHRYARHAARQVAELRQGLIYLGARLHVVWAEGDSTDTTREDLRALAPMAGATVIDATHGGPPFGPVEDAQRFRQLAFVANRLLDAVPGDTDVVLFIESDLLWTPQQIIALLGHMPYLHAVAPMVMHVGNGPHVGDGPFFYDTFAFRSYRRRFTNEPPYHPQIPRAGLIMPMESVGSCVAVQARYALECRFPAEDVFVGYCAALRAAGALLWMDPKIAVYHP